MSFDCHPYVFVSGIAWWDFTPKSIWCAGAQWHGALCSGALSTPFIRQNPRLRRGRVLLWIRGRAHWVGEQRAHAGAERVPGEKLPRVESAIASYAKYGVLLHTQRRGEQEAFT
jgi:hypothetical protein